MFQVGDRVKDKTPMDAVASEMRGEVIGSEKEGSIVMIRWKGPRQRAQGRYPIGMALQQFVKIDPETETD